MNMYGGYSEIKVRKREMFSRDKKYNIKKNIGRDWLMHGIFRWRKSWLLIKKVNNYVSAWIF